MLVCRCSSCRVLLPLVVMVVACLVTSTATTIYPSPNPRETEASYWNDLMREEILEALERPKNTGKAKNVLIFLGDGMGITVGTASRILKGQKQGVSGEEGNLVWERFPNVGLLKTYNVDKQVPDSAGTAMAYLSGVKVNYKTLGVSGKTKRWDCAASLLPENRLDTILKWAQDAGMDTGVVTTVEVTHATPAALYAKAAERNWQCDTIMMRENASDCLDIALQLVQEEPGKNMKVIMGGGRQYLGAPQEESEQECPRSDGRNLVQEWQKEKDARGATHAYVTTTRQLSDVNPETTDYLMGLFAERQTPFEVDRDQGPEGTPSLKEMTQKALKILQKGPNGFFLLVEGGMIDLGLHDTKARRALEEAVMLDQAVEAALEMLDLKETLVLVTADHSHTMTMSGYPPRGNDILGVVTNDKVTDGLPYTTLMFASGQGYHYTWNGEKVQRRNLTGVDTTDKDFEAQAAVPTMEGEETHGGEDVAVFAIGPMSHLFHRTHEQTYVAHVMGFAACIGPYREDCHRPLEKTPEQCYSHSSGEAHEEDSAGDGSQSEMASEGGQTVPGEGAEDAGNEPQEIPEEVPTEDPAGGGSQSDMAPEGGQTVLGDAEDAGKEPEEIPEEVPTEDSAGGGSQSDMAPEGGQTVAGDAEDAGNEPEESPEEVSTELKEDEGDDDEEEAEEEEDEEEDGEGVSIKPVEEEEGADGELPVASPATANVHTKHLRKNSPGAGTAANTASCVTVVCLALILCKV